MYPQYVTLIHKAHYPRPELGTDSIKNTNASHSAVSTQLLEYELHFVYCMVKYEMEYLIILTHTSMNYSPCVTVFLNAHFS